MLAEPMDVRIEALPEALVVHIKGECAITLHPLEATFTRLSAQRPKLVVLDLAGVTFISSLGMGSMLAFRRGLSSHGGQVRLAAVQPLVLDAFRRAHLYEVFSFHPTVAEACAG
ncbi:MAG TPA: STAS domain-containing protein [Tepidisphaeraceae bacterium]